MKDVQAYASDDHEPGEGVCRAIADTLKDELCERFREYWDIDDTADTACFRRLISFITPMDRASRNCGERPGTDTGK